LQVRKPTISHTIPPIIRKRRLLRIVFCQIIGWMFSGMEKRVQENIPKGI
jgi:hypothetical protein